MRSQLPPAGRPPLPRGRKRAFVPHPLRQPNPRAGTHPKAERRRPARPAVRNLSINTLTKIPGIRLAHDPPPNTVNHKPNLKGIPPDSILRSDALITFG